MSGTLADPGFKTRYYHKRIGHLLRLDRSRPAGTRDEPELVALDPLSGVTPSEQPPVRIFLGTEPAQHRAERVSARSIPQARDPAPRHDHSPMQHLTAHIGTPPRRASRCPQY